MSQEQPPFGLPGPVLAGIQRRPDPELRLIAPLCSRNSLLVALTDSEKHFKNPGTKVLGFLFSPSPSNGIPIPSMPCALSDQESAEYFQNRMHLP